MGILFYEHRKYLRQKKETVILTEKIDSFLYNLREPIPETLTEGYLANLNNELNRLEKRFLDITEESKTRENEVLSFVENLAHQFKNMLTSMQIQLDLAEKKELSGNRTNILKCREAVDRLTKDIDMILCSGQLAEGKIGMKDEMISLGEMLENVIGTVSSIATEDNVTIILKKDNDMTFYGDKYWIGQAVQNVVKNAVEHSGENGKVCISVNEDYGTLKIGVEDTGKGISLEEQNKLFRRFYRGGHGKKGYGLGLSMARDIVQAHHGNITVGNSEYGEASFVISLPLVHKEDIYAITI